MMAGRLVSVDAFRGLTVLLMVLVNTAGMFPHSYGQLRHVEWDGWTLTDTVFPTFLWLVGLSITLSRRTASVGRILRRGTILYALGLFLYGFPFFDIATWRVLGVLQRIAICYVVAALMYRRLGVKALLVTTFGLILLWMALMGPGPWEPGNNFAARVDAAVLGAHNYAATKTWDPEGLVSTLTAISTTLLGVLAGRLVRAASLVRMVALGLMLIVSAALLNPVIPVNKMLWSPTFVLLMAGLDFLVSALLIYIVDVKKWVQRAARVLALAGTNAIAVYMISEVGETILTFSGTRVGLYKTLFLPALPPEHATFLYAISYTALMLLIAWAMHRRGWYLRV